MPDKLGALVSVPAPAIVSDPESRAPKKEREIEIMFEREREKKPLWGSFRKNIIWI